MTKQDLVIFNSLAVVLKRYGIDINDIISKEEYVGYRHIVQKYGDIGDAIELQDILDVVDRFLRKFEHIGKKGDINNDEL